jgi:peptide/nickel transport system permease protein
VASETRATEAEAPDSAPPGLDVMRASRRARLLRMTRGGRSIPGIIVRRVIYGVIVIFAVLCVIFLASHAIGDPAAAQLPPEAPQSEINALQVQLGLNRPLIVQFFTVVPQWLTGNFGESAWQHVPALPLAIARLTNTIYLGLATAVLFIPLALVLGTIAGLRPKSVADKLITTISSIGSSIAPFWLGLMLVLIFAVHLKALPSEGFGGVRFVLLPALALFLKPAGRVAQITRTAVDEQMNQAYVNAARVRGLGDFGIALRHVLKNAAIPIVTIIGDELITLFSAAVVVESVFAWPGIGQLMLQAIQVRDTQLLTACVAVIATTVVIINLIVDLSYLLFDPRVRR